MLIHFFFLMFYHFSKKWWIFLNPVNSRSTLYSSMFLFMFYPSVWITLPGYTKIHLLNNQEINIISLHDVGEHGSPHIYLKSENCLWKIEKIDEWFSVVFSTVLNLDFIILDWLLFMTRHPSIPYDLTDKGSDGNMYF